MGHLAERCQCFTLKTFVDLRLTGLLLNLCEDNNLIAATGVPGVLRIEDREGILFQYVTTFRSNAVGILMKYRGAGERRRGELAFKLFSMLPAHRLHTLLVNVDPQQCDYAHSYCSILACALGMLAKQNYEPAIEALKVNTSIASVDLYNYGIGVEGAKALADALRINTFIASVNLGKNGIGIEGAKALAYALRINTSIASVDLSDNEIGVERAKAFTEALEDVWAPRRIAMNYSDWEDGGGLWF